MVTDLSGRVVAPGDEVTLQFRIKSFDTYRESFAERATVVTDAGDLDLWVSGRVPAKREALAYPPALFIEPDTAGMWPDRTLRLRVTSSCALDPDAIEVRPVLLGPTAAEVVEEPPSGPYREFLLRVNTSPDDAGAPAGASLRVDAGCSTVEIPVRFASRPSNEG